MSMDSENLLTNASSMFLMLSSSDASDARMASSSLVPPEQPANPTIPMESVKRAARTTRKPCIVDRDFDFYIIHIISLSCQSFQKPLQLETFYRIWKVFSPQALPLPPDGCAVMVAPRRGSR